MQADVGPYTLRVEGIQCLIPSSGTSGAEGIGWMAGVLGGALAAVFGAQVGGLITVGSGGTLTWAGVAFVAFTTVEFAAFSEAIAQAARSASVGIGSHMDDQVYVKLNGKKIFPTGDYKNMNRGDYLSIGHEIRRDDGIYTISVHEHDLILSDDMLYSYGIDSDLECARFPLVLSPESDAEGNHDGSIYIIWLTATLAKGSRELVNEEHLKRLEGDPNAGPLTEWPGLAFYQMAAPTGGSWPSGVEFVDFISRFATKGWEGPSYYQTISVVEAGGTVDAMGRTGRGLELYKVLGDDWDRIWLDDNFANSKGKWGREDYYSTIQPAVVDDRLFILGHTSAGVKIYGWDDAKGKLSENLDTATRFKGDNWKERQYHRTIQTVTWGDTLYILGRTGSGVVMYYWNNKKHKWSEKLATNKRFKNPNWSSPEYYETIQAVEVAGDLYLLGRGSKGVEIYDWRGTDWSKNLATCTAFKDAGWNEAKYYTTIHTAVVRGKLYLIGRGKEGVEIHAFNKPKKKWKSLIGAGQWSIFTDESGASKRSWNRTFQSAVLDDRIYIGCRTSKGFEIYGFDAVSGEKSTRLAKCDAFADPRGKKKHVYATIGMMARDNGVFVYGRIPTDN